MKKDVPFVLILGVSLLAFCILLIAAMADDSNMSAPSGDHQKAISTTLVGYNITYYSIAGKPLNYTIGPGDIQSITQTSYGDSPAWQVRIGQGLAWDITMSDDGTRILDVRQLFVT
jgi:hypothetical protein